jgi:predicted metalloprotease
MRLAAMIVGVVIVLGLGGAPSRAEKRVALVIGNGGYKNAQPLPNPKNDAQDVSAALKRQGFEVIVGLDLDKSGMEEVTIRFARAARDADVALFYYSGHALQFGGINYLMPVDAKLNDDADLRRLTRVDEILADLQQARSLRILVLDSCRDNPLADSLKRSIGLTRGASIQRGLARIDAPQGMIVAYATQPGRTAEDGHGRNSPYTTAFLRHIEAADEIGTVFRRVSAAVYEATGHRQLPELSLSLIGEYYLRGQPQTQVGAAPTLDSPAQAWGAVKDTTSAAVLEEFVQRFSDTIYGALAQDRLEALKKAQTAAVTPTPSVQPGAPPSRPTAEPGNGTSAVATGAADQMGQFVSRVLGGTEVQWEKIFASSGKTYEPPTLVMFSGATRSGCGFAQSAMGPFYCPNDRKVYLDISFFHDLERRFRACDVGSKACQFSQAYVIAHEVGHHVQNLLGILPKAQQMEQSYKVQANDIQVRVELQADCLAGIWASHSEESWKFIEPGDVEAAMQTASAIGELQKQAKGYVVPDALFTHGSSEQRTRWFTRGLKTGKVESCDTFIASQL